jgi:uncharacterized protein (TIGR04552 family)
MVKKEHHAANIHDRVRFRFVVDDGLQLMGLLQRMLERLIPFNYVVPGQSVNHLVNFTAFVEANPEYRQHQDELQLELGDEESEMKHVNEFSGPTYRVINFVVDVPIRVPDEVLARGQDQEGLGRVVFALAEFQVVDQKTDEENERGENRHDKYRARQRAIVRERLERGKRGFGHDDDGKEKSATHAKS